MSKARKKLKRRLVSMTSTAELHSDSSITVQSERRYEDGEIVNSRSTARPGMGLYRQCKKHFRLVHPGDWATTEYTWINGEWIDADSNRHWVFD